MAKTDRTDEIQGKIVHVYDDIEEADNELPRWWLAIFYLSAIFAVIYWFYYEEYRVGASAMQAYEEAQDAIAKKAGGVTGDMLLALAAKPDAVAAGQKEFMVTCVACHEKRGEGKIGANLTDEFWIHGGSPTDIHNSITNGSPAKGMPAWGPALGAEKVKNLTAFVLSIRNTNVAGKAAEGERYSGR